MPSTDFCPSATELTSFSIKQKRKIDSHRSSDLDPSPSTGGTLSKTYFCTVIETLQKYVKMNKRNNDFENDEYSLTYARRQASKYPCITRLIPFFCGARAKSSNNTFRTGWSGRQCQTSTD